MQKDDLLNCRVYRASYRIFSRLGTHEKRTHRGRGRRTSNVVDSARITTPRDQAPKCWIWYVTIRRRSLSFMIDGVKAVYISRAALHIYILSALLGTLT